MSREDVRLVAVPHGEGPPAKPDPWVRKTVRADAGFWVGKVDAAHRRPPAAGRAKSTVCTRGSWRHEVNRARRGVR